MRVYNIKFKFPVTINIEEELEDDFEGEDNSYEDIGIAEFQVAAGKLQEAYTVADEYIKFTFEDLEEDDWEIIEVSEIQQLNIVNWPVEASPFVDIEDAASEDILNFKCAYCNIDIKVLDGWNSIVCPGCKKVIERDKVIGSNVKYIMIKTKI